MTRLRLLSALSVACAGALLGAILLVPNPDAALLARLDQVQPGMTEAEVEEVMGGEPTYVMHSQINDQTQRLLHWNVSGRGEGATASVVCDSNGIVLGKATQYFKPSFMQRIRRWLGW